MPLGDLREWRATSFDQHADWKVVKGGQAYSKRTQVVQPALRRCVCQRHAATRHSPRSPLLNFFAKPFPHFHGRAFQWVIRDGLRHTGTSSNERLQITFGKQLLESAKYGHAGNLQLGGEVSG